MATGHSLSFPRCLAEGMDNLNGDKILNDRMLTGIDL